MTSRDGVGGWGGTGTTGKMGGSPRREGLELRRYRKIKKKEKHVFFGCFF